MGDDNTVRFSIFSQILLNRLEITLRHNDTRPHESVSRRGFLKGVGISSVASGGLLAGSQPENAEAADLSAPVGPDGVPVTLNINGRSETITIEPRTTLLDVLRNRFELTGAKKVCDQATCGACTVLRDGKPIYSCTTLAIEVQGSKITTVEALGKPEKLHPLQSAFVKNDAQQCGFCTPGFILACASFLKTHPDPTPEQIEAGLGGNLCRCGTYQGIKKAIVDAAKTMNGGA